MRDDIVGVRGALLGDKGEPWLVCGALTNAAAQKARVAFAMGYRGVVVEAVGTTECCRTLHRSSNEIQRDAQAFFSPKTA